MYKRLNRPIVIHFAMSTTNDFKHAAYSSFNRTKVGEVAF